MTSKPGPEQSMWETVLRKLLSETKVRREIIATLFSQIDDTKNAALGAIAKEVRAFLESTDLATLLVKILTSVSFEVRTEVRFIANETGGLRPVVRSNVKAHSGKTDRQAPEADDDGDF